MKNNTNQKDRMKQLVKAFEEKNEILKENNVVDNNDIIIKSSERLRQIARIDEWLDNNNNKYLPNQGLGTTVNTFIPDNNTAGQQQNDIPKKYNPSFTYLQPSEALSLCIKRVVESGVPVNNLGFYEEVNWNLNNMGFNGRMPIDIKELLKKMISGE